MEKPLSVATSTGDPSPSEEKAGERWLAMLVRPFKAFHWVYLPLMMVYFPYGASGIIDVTRDLWIKEQLTLSPADLAGIGVCLNLPWTVKMVFGELVDSVPIFGSQRKAYVLIGVGTSGLERRATTAVPSPCKPRQHGDTHQNASVLSAALFLRKPGARERSGRGRAVVQNPVLRLLV